MRQYRFSIYAKLQLLLGIRYDIGVGIDIQLPFLSIYIGLLDGAKDTISLIS